METDPELITTLTKEWPIQLSETASGEALRQELAAQLNKLILEDFEKLVFLLYRIDVDEARMRALLANKKDSDAGLLLADLIIERQLQKIKSRQEFSKRDDQISQEEKW
jgi:hypothetical protein